MGEQFTLGQPEHHCSSAFPLLAGVRSVLLLHLGLVPALPALLMPPVLAPRPGCCATLGCTAGEGAEYLGWDFDVNIC